MNQQGVTTAITNALVQGGSQWLISTIVAFLPVLWTMALMLHLGRPYILRTLRSLGLRLGADVWWMSYVIIRDAVLLIAFGLSWIFFNPNTVMNLPLPITGPISALCLLLALAVKLSRRVDDDVNAYRLTTIFLVLGATLYYGPLVFAVEATSQSYLAGFSTTFTSSSNPTTALVIMWISLAGVALVTAWLIYRLMLFTTRSMAKRLVKGQASPTHEPASAGQ